MFELLLQADKALASGALDQAERSYGQLIEHDPTNSIAVAGLAGVSLKRGDQRLARTFAERALAIDPDSFAAKRIIDTLEGRGVKPPAFDEPDLPLLAAQHLEALGRRRTTGHPGADVHMSASPPQTKPTNGRKTAPEEARNPLPQLPVEPLRGRQAGRRATAAASGSVSAAAEAAPRPQARRGAKTHQALGDRARRHFSPEALKPPPRSEDPFEVAESAAAVEAVEAVDEADDLVLAHPFEPAEGGAQTDELGQVLGTVEAADEDNRIALRALVSYQLEATESDAAEVDAAEMGAALESAELGAAELQAADPRAAERREPELDEAEPEAARAEQAAQAARAAPATEEVGAVEPTESIAPRRAEIDHRTSESADAEAALAAAELAAAELAAAEQIAEAEFEAVRHGSGTAASQPAADGGDEPPIDWSNDGEGTAGAEATPQRHRHWLLRRFLGG